MEEEGREQGRDGEVSGTGRARDPWHSLILQTLPTAWEEGGGHRFPCEAHLGRELWTAWPGLLPLGSHAAVCLPWGARMLCHNTGRWMSWNEPGKSPKSSS